MLDWERGPRRGVVRVKSPVYSDEAIYLVVSGSGEVLRERSARATENRTRHVGTLSSL